MKSIPIEAKGRIASGMALAGLLFLLLPLASVRAAGQYGNVGSDDSTTLSITMGTGETTQNGVKGLSQTFTLPTSTIYPSALTVYVQPTSTATDGIRLRLCAYPDQALADPCSTGTVLYERTDAETGFNDFTAGATDPMAFTFALPSGFVLYPGIPYGLFFDRTGTAASGGTWRVAYTTGDFTDGTAKKSIGGSCGASWLHTGASSPSDCASTSGDTRDLRFHFGYVSSGVTISLTPVGGQLFAVGTCVQGSELPDGWTANGFVDIEYRDTSATGTWLLASASCNGGTWSAGGKNVWNGEWQVVARQYGTPISYEASATSTIDLAGNPTENPVVTLGLSSCPDAGFLGENLDNALPCYLRAFAKTFRDTPPIQWWYQLSTVFSATTTVPVEATLTLPNGGSWTLYSSASDAGIVGELEDTPEVLGMDWMELQEFGLWITFGFYLLARARGFFSAV